MCLASESGVYIQQKNQFIFQDLLLLLFEMWNQVVSPQMKTWVKEDYICLFVTYIYLFSIKTSGL